MASCICNVHEQVGDGVDDFVGGGKKEKKGTGARKGGRRVGGGEGGMVDCEVGLEEG